MGNVLKEIADKLDSYESGKLLGVVDDVRQAIDRGFKPAEVLENGLLEGLSRVGAKFKTGEVFISEVLMVAKVINNAMDVLRPLMTQGELKRKGRVILGTVKGDLHDIGKNLVGIMLESAGFEVIDVGINVPRERFVEAVKENSVELLGLSALLTTTMGEMKAVIEAFRSEGLNTKIIVGGAPITREFAEEIGADGYGEDAAEAVEVLTDLAAKHAAHSTQN